MDIKSKVLEKCWIFSGACVYAIVGLEPDVVIVGAACTITTAMHPLFFFLSFSVATFHCQCHCCSHITYECASTHIWESRGHTFFGCTIVAELHKKLTIEPGREYSFYFLRFIRLFMRGLLLKWSRRVCLFA